MHGRLSRAVGGGRAGRNASEEEDEEGKEASVKCHGEDEVEGRVLELEAEDDEDAGGFAFQKRWLRFAGRSFLRRGADAPMPRWKGVSKCFVRTLNHAQ